MLKLVNIGKVYPGQTALQDINLEIKKGEFFSLLGPSGCGKSTLLRIIAGLETATTGEIYLDGMRIDSLESQKRPFNMVFQRYGLFPHMNVFENIAFGLKIKKLNSSEIRGQVESVLSLVGLESFSSRMPETLSGGQAQRVAIARAIVNKPKILLLDEPLSALDQKMREHMQIELKGIQRKVGITFIFVTHDQDEALSLSDRVCVLNQGRIEQVSDPQQLYESPESVFVSEFVGSNNKINGGYVRPENIKISLTKGRYKGVLSEKIFKGSHYIFCIEGESKIIAYVETNDDVLNYKIGSTVYFDFNESDLQRVRG